jgi:hypothetical protein
MLRDLKEYPTRIFFERRKARISFAKGVVYEHRENIIDCANRVLAEGPFKEKQEEALRRLGKEIDPLNDGRLNGKRRRDKKKSDIVKQEQ